MHLEQHIELDNLITMQNLRTSANKGSNDAYDVQSLTLVKIFPGIIAGSKRKLKEACKSPWCQVGNLKSFTLTIPWNLAQLVEIFPGIIARLRHHRSETNGIAERSVRRVKEGTSVVLLRSRLD